MEKKRISWSILSIMLVAMLCVGFASCSKDDNDEGESASSKIIGTWHLVGHEQWRYDDGLLKEHWIEEYKKESSTFYARRYEVVNGKETGDYRDSDSSMDLLEFAFGADGTFAQYNNGRKLAAGTYYVSSDSLKFIYENSSTILNNKCSFKGDQLVLKYENYGGDKLKVREIYYFNNGAYPNK